MLVIRFSRIGKRNHAQYKIVVAEKSAPIKGRFVEQLGSYDPHMKQAMIKEDRIKYWMDQGAQVTDSVWNLLVKKGVIKGDKREVVLRPKKGEEGEEGKPETDPTSPEASKGADAKEEKTREAPKEEKSAKEKKPIEEAPKKENKPEKKEEKSKEESKKE